MPADTPPQPAPRLRGFACPQCEAPRLFVTAVRKPCAGRVVRYRKCSACGFRVVTDEKARPAKG